MRDKEVKREEGRKEDFLILGHISSASLSLFQKEERDTPRIQQEGNQEESKEKVGR